MSSIFSANCMAHLESQVQVDRCDCPSTPTVPGHAYHPRLWATLHHMRHHLLWHEHRGEQCTVWRVRRCRSSHRTSFLSSVIMSLCATRAHAVSFLKGITFNLIIIRVNDGTASERGFTTTSNSPEHNAPSYPLQFMHTATYNSEIPTFHVPAEVSVEVEVTRHSDDDDDDSRLTKAGHEPWKGGEAV